MQGMMRAISDAASERGSRLDNDKAKRLFDAGEAGDRGGSAGEPAADHAQSEWRLPHLAPDRTLGSCLGQIDARNKTKFR
jgi:hypothetical protein